jgi:hypothetical protein
LNGSDRIESADGGARPEQSRDDEFHGGAITGDGYLVIKSITSRKKYTNR